MNKDVFFNTMKKVLINWCENRAKNKHDIGFSLDYCAGKTYIRFTTQIIDSILPPSDNNKGEWKNGHYIFYEINNRPKKITISCVISQEDLSSSEKEICELLINTTGKKVTKENWRTKFLRTWEIYKYQEDEKFEIMLKNINSSLTDILENDISTFERKFFIPVFNKIEKEDDELTSVVIEKGAVEGAKIKYFSTKYERSMKNRMEAINIHGTKCMVCGFNFEAVYGELGKGFIEVHHINPLSDLEEEVCINPLDDLVCLCSNCHRMIHRKKDGIFSVKELRELIQDNKQVK